jgi:hypothetical protein
MSTVRLYIGGMGRAGSLVALGLAAFVVVGMMVALQGSPLGGLWDRGDGTLNLGTPRVGIDARVKSNHLRPQAQPKRATSARPAPVSRGGSPQRPAAAPRGTVLTPTVTPSPRPRTPGAVPLSPAAPIVSSGTSRKHLGTGVGDVVEGTGNRLGQGVARVSPGLGSTVQNLTGALANTVNGLAGPQTPAGRLITGLGLGGSPPASP